MNPVPIAAGKSSFNLIDKYRFFQEVEKSHSPLIADFACGIGNYSIALSRKDINYQIIALDFWEDGIISLKKEIKENNIKNITPIHADLSSHIPLEDSSIDLGIMATIVHDLIYENSFKRAMENINKKIKKGGYLFILEFRVLSPPPGPPMDIRLSPHEIIEYIEPYGFKNIETIGMGEYIYMVSFKKTA